MTTPGPAGLGTHGDAPALISVCFGCVRIGHASTWDEARAMLRRDINNSYPMFPNDVAGRHRQYELDRLADGPSPMADGSGLMLVTSGSWAWSDTQRYAADGHHGLTTGDTCTIHECTNAGGYRVHNYTPDVQAVIVSVNGTGHRVTVRITGESVQFDRDEVTVPTTFIHPYPPRRR
jgi:hypothetical protein